MKTTAYISFIYGMIVILNGIMAYTFANSVFSLFMEIFLGVIILISAFFMIKEKKIAFIIVLVISLLLAIFYGYNFSKTHSFFQALMAGISVLVACYELFKVFHVSGRE